MSGADGLGLGKMGAFDLSAMLEPTVERFREIGLDDIREDGENPRETFDPDTLEELAATIRARGVITPISVRPDPDRDGGYLVNHGHRRLRAARLAGLDAIPAVIDASFRDEDRIIENIQRDNLGMFEVANYISRKLGEGMKQKEIAERIGKSTAYVSNHVQLLELPPQTGLAVEKGVAVDLTTITDLAKIEKKNPDALKKFLSGRNEVTRRAVRDFRADLDEGGTPVVVVDRGRPAAVQETPKPSDKDKDGNDFNYAGHGQVPPELSRFPETMELTGGWKRGRVVVKHRSGRAVMLLERKPSDETRVWIRDEDGNESEVALSSLKLLAVVGE